MTSETAQAQKLEWWDVGDDVQQERSSKRRTNEASKEVRDWWKEIDDADNLEDKKIRREKHVNVNKVNRVFITKKEGPEGFKRFYNKPSISWGDLVTKDADTLYKHEDGTEMDQNDKFDDLGPSEMAGGWHKGKTDISQYDKFLQFDYVENDDGFEIPTQIPDDEVNQMDGIEAVDGFNLDDTADVEATDDEEEEWEQRKDTESEGDLTSNADRMSMDGMDDDDDSKEKPMKRRKRKKLESIWDDKGLCTLRLDCEHTSIYRKESENLKNWEKLRNEFIRTSITSKLQLKERREKKRREQMIRQMRTDEMRQMKADERKKESLKRGRFDRDEQNRKVEKSLERTEKYLKMLESTVAKSSGDSHRKKQNAGVKRKLATSSKGWGGRERERGHAKGRRRRGDGY